MQYKTSINSKELGENKPVRVAVNGKELMVVIIGGKPYVIDANCSHRGGPLEKGALKDYNVTCPWHSAVYDVRTGHPSPTTPWGHEQNSYVATIDMSGEILIEI